MVNWVDQLSINQPITRQRISPTLFPLALLASTKLRPPPISSDPPKFIPSYVRRGLSTRLAFLDQRLARLEETRRTPLSPQPLFFSRFLCLSTSRRLSVNCNLMSSPVPPWPPSYYSYLTSFLQV
ncbi:hypothetical protein PoB_006252700 [Plakobranchus ocellatus]|uniref:Uncharacterized protein n=1 Tax=Plakobranchus ocellatus TaxID=259542 RepID=A0AAV4CVT4_9GAST|nr:hypothetical protein PoB_006252700 [Plakobranchus ocellatus]